jgi:hypothetical protein
MQQGRGGIGSHKHGVSGYPLKSPRLRLLQKLAAERGEFDAPPRRRRQEVPFASVRDLLNATSGQPKTTARGG